MAKEERQGACTSHHWHHTSRGRKTRPPIRFRKLRQLRNISDIQSPLPPSFPADILALREESKILGCRWDVLSHSPSIQFVGIAPQTNTVLKNWFENERLEMGNSDRAQQRPRLLLCLPRTRISGRQDTAAGETTHHFIGNISPKSPCSAHPGTRGEGWKLQQKNR